MSLFFSNKKGLAAEQSKVRGREAWALLFIILKTDNSFGQLIIFELKLFHIAPLTVIKLNTKKAEALSPTDSGLCALSEFSTLQGLQMQCLYYFGSCPC